MVVFPLLSFACSAGGCVDWAGGSRERDGQGERALASLLNHFRAIRFCFPFNRRSSSSFYGCVQIEEAKSHLLRAAFLAPGSHLVAFNFGNIEAGQVPNNHNGGFKNAIENLHRPSILPSITLHHFRQRCCRETSPPLCAASSTCCGLERTTLRRCM
jgi:hypothetical protein